MKRFLKNLIKIKIQILARIKEFLNKSNEIFNRRNTFSEEKKIVDTIYYIEERFLRKR